MEKYDKIKKDLKLTGWILFIIAVLNLIEIIYGLVNKVYILEYLPIENIYVVCSLISAVIMVAVGIIHGKNALDRVSNKTDKKYNGLLWLGIVVSFLGFLYVTYDKFFGGTLIYPYDRIFIFNTTFEFIMLLSYMYTSKNFDKHSRE